MHILNHTLYCNSVSLGLGCRSVVECLPSMYKALGSIPFTTKHQNKKKNSVNLIKGQTNIQTSNEKDFRPLLKDANPWSHFRFILWILTACYVCVRPQE